MFWFDIVSRLTDGIFECNVFFFYIKEFRCFSQRFGINADLRTGLLALYTYKLLHQFSVSKT